MIKKLILIFVIAFLLNLAWEFAHAPLYVHYRGGAITPGVLVRAALFDAAIIALAARFIKPVWLSALLLIVFAILLEYWALSTGRWAYGDAMPTIPILGVGLSPVLQLALTYMLTLKLAKR